MLRKIKIAVEAVSSIISGGRLPVTLGATPTIDIGDVTCQGVIAEGQTRTAIAEGEVDKLSLTGWKELRTKDQRQLDLANCNDHTDYTALSNDTTGKADSLDHVFGTGSITFNKVNGADNTKFAGVEETITAVNFSEIFEAGAFLGMGLKIPDLTGVVNAFIRLGTDASNYNEWTILEDDMTADVWMVLRTPTAKPCCYAGNGWDQSAVTYIAFGVESTAETTEIAGIIFDNIHLVGGRVTDSMSNTDPSTSQNINIAKVRGTRVPVDSGNANAGTQRITVATDDVNLAAINTAVKNADLKLYSEARMTIGATNNLPTLSSLTLPAGTLAVAIIPESIVAVRFNMAGDASATTPKLPEAGMVIPVTKTDADLIELYSASATYAALMVFVARN